MSSGVGVCPPLVTVAAQWWSLRRPCHTHPGCTRAVEEFRRARTCGPEALLGGGRGVPCVLVYLWAAALATAGKS